MRNGSSRGLYCNSCRKPLAAGKVFVRRGKRKLALTFCSLECNVKNLEGNVRDDAGEKLLQEGRAQFKAAKPWYKRAVGL